MHSLIERMGLADPVRYTWCLRARFAARRSLSVLWYLVMNGTIRYPGNHPPMLPAPLPTALLPEFCPLVDYADAFEHRADPLQRFYTLWQRRDRLMVLFSPADA
jgi:hypothetical protein